MRARLLVFVLCMLLLAAGLPLGASYLGAQRLFASLRSDRLDNLTREVLIRHQAFEMILADADNDMHRLLGNALPRIAAALSAKGDPLAASPDLLAALAREHGLNQLYVIDERGVIRSTSFSADLGFDLAGVSASMRGRLHSLLGSGRMVSDPLDVSANSGELSKYGYFGPAGGRFVLEGSIDVRRYVQARHSDEFSSFVFNRLLVPDVEGMSDVAGVDVYYGGPGHLWSIVHQGEQLDAALSASARPGRVVEQSGQGQTVRYSFFGQDLGPGKEHLGRVLGVKVVYDEKNLRQDVDRGLRRLLLYVGLVGLGGVVAVLSLFRAMVVRPMRQVLDGVRRIADGDYTREVAVSGPSELAEVGRGVDAMQKALADREKRLEAALAEVERLAGTDGLTGLANRRQMDAMLARECALAQRHGLPLSVVLFDIDHFKQVNDRYGHQAGDEVLRTLGGLVLARVRASDMAARYGGEEFLLILPNTRQDHAEQLAESLRKQVAQTPIPEAGHVRISLGVAELSPGETQEGLLGRVDEALYMAKNRGRDQVVSARPLARATP